MIPPIEQFRKMVNKYNGNLSKVAEACGVTRTTLEAWKNHSPEYKQAVKDARMRLFDKCLVTSEVLALGIPIKDDDGKLIGWEEKPDGNMLRYLMGKLGADEGFGDGEATKDKDAEAIEPSGIEISVTYNEKKHLALQGESDKVEGSAELAE